MEYYRNTKNSITIRYANASVIGASASTAVSRQSSALSTTVPSYIGRRDGKQFLKLYRSYLHGTLAGTREPVYEGTVVEIGRAHV